MRRHGFMLVFAMVLAGGVANTSNAGGKGKSSECSSRHCHCHRERERHHCFLEDPPRGPVVSSMAAPVMNAAPALPFNALRTISAPPEMLRSLAKLIEDKKEEEDKPASAPTTPAAGPTTQKPNQSSARFLEGGITGRAPVNDQVSELEGRLSKMEERMKAMQTRTDGILDRLEKALEKIR